MSKVVRFAMPEKDHVSTNLSQNMTFGGTTEKAMIPVVIVGVLLGLVFLIVWILGLVRMGKCGGRQSWLWWTCIFVPLFIPGIGQLYGFVVAIMALVMLRNGGKLLTMQCSK